MERFQQLAHEMVGAGDSEMCGLADRRPVDSAVPVLNCTGQPAGHKQVLCVAVLRMPSLGNCWLLSTDYTRPTHIVEGAFAESLLIWMLITS